MRFDKFTTRFQQALTEAQSMAIGQDNPYIEPQHLLWRFSNRTMAVRLPCFPVLAPMLRP
jgi:ATP-dependent Clp protease ATP-binding subunit ClpA